MVTDTTIQQQCRDFIDMVREVRFTKVRDRQVSKFNRLLHKNILKGNMDDRQVANNNNASGNESQTQSHTCINNNQMQGSGVNEGNNVSTVSQGNKWVVNLSKSPLTPTLESPLSRGPNFALAPTNPPNVEFITAVELVCQRLFKQDLQELRAEINYLLKKAKTPRSNITKDEKKALKGLRENKERKVPTVDKGVAMVVMDRKEYLDKVEGLLAQPAYKSITSDHTNKLKAKLIQKLKGIKRETNMEEGMYRTMYPTSCTAPMFYGFPKIHKTGTPSGQ